MLQGLATSKLSDSRAAFVHSRSLMVLAICLLLADALLLFANGLHYIAVTVSSGTGFLELFRADSWNREIDGSLIEILGYIQLAAAGIILFMQAVRHKAPVYGMWACVFLVLMADDSPRRHERIGHVMVAWLNLPSVLGLRPQDLGELSAWAVFGIILGAGLIVTHLKSPPRVRHNSLVLFCLTAVLAFFAVVVDMVEEVVWGFFPRSAHGVIVPSETGGEVASMTLMLVGVAFIASRPSGFGFASVSPDPRVRAASPVPAPRTGEPRSGRILVTPDSGETTSPDARRVNIHRLDR